MMLAILGHHQFTLAALTTLGLPSHMYTRRSQVARFKIDVYSASENCVIPENEPCALKRFISIAKRQLKFSLASMTAPIAHTLKRPRASESAVRASEDVASGSDDRQALHFDNPKTMKCSSSLELQTPFCALFGASGQHELPNKGFNPCDNLTLLSDPVGPDGQLLPAGSRACARRQHGTNAFAETCCANFFWQPSVHCAALSATHSQGLAMISRPGGGWLCRKHPCLAAFDAEGGLNTNSTYLVEELNAAKAIVP